MPPRAAHDGEAAHVGRVGGDGVRRRRGERRDELRRAATPVDTASVDRVEVAASVGVVDEALRSAPRALGKSRTAEYSVLIDRER